MGKKIAIIDYSLGNMFSVQQALNHFGADAEITGDRKKVEEASAIVLPGVGAFAEAMNCLNESGLSDAIRNSISAGKPFLGICLGMQLLFEKSEEFGDTKGLGIVEGTIEKFKFEDKKMHVPQMAWNHIYEPEQGKWTGTHLTGVDNGEYMHFVHSYYAKPKKKENILCETEYGGIKYCSAVIKDNVFATQFHPEKSAGKGLIIYKNWIEKI